MINRHPAEIGKPFESIPVSLSFPALWMSIPFAEVLPSLYAGFSKPRLMVLLLRLLPHLRETQYMQTYKKIFKRIQQSETIIGGDVRLHLYDLDWLNRNA